MMTTPTRHQFSVRYFIDMYNWADFFFQIRLHNLDSYWVLYHTSVVFFSIPFKSQNGTLGMYSIYMPNFNQCLSAVYPVGVTDPWPFLCEKLITSDSNQNWYRYVPVFAPSFSSISKCICIFYGWRCKVCKMKKKEIIKKNYWLYLMIDWCNLLYIWYVDFPIWQASLQQNWIRNHWVI